MDIAGPEAAANAASEDDDYVDILEREGDNDATPSKSRTRTRSTLCDRLPFTLSDVDTSDPIIVAAQTKRFLRLVEQYHDDIAATPKIPQKQISTPVPDGRTAHRWDLRVFGMTFSSTGRR
jgi:hypothetical protein